MTVNNDDSQVGEQNAIAATRIIRPATKQPKDWISVYDDSVSTGSMSDRALCDLPMALDSLFDLALAIRDEEHLFMLTVNGGGTVTLSHHHRATGSSGKGNDGINAFGILAVIGKKSSSPLLQLHTPGDAAFETITTTTPSDKRLLQAAKSTNPNAFAALQLVTDTDQTSHPPGLQDVQTETKSFMFVPPRIAQRLLHAPTYMSPGNSAELVLQATSNTSGGGDNEEHVIATSLLRWLWCAQNGVLQSSSFMAPVDSDSASRVAEDLKRSYLQSVATVNSCSAHKPTQKLRALESKLAD